MSDFEGPARQLMERADLIAATQFDEAMTVASTGTDDADVGALQAVREVILSRLRKAWVIGYYAGAGLSIGGPATRGRQRR